jgi:flagellar basal body rod protein FlgG
MVSSIMGSSATALVAYATRLNGTAANLANVNTDGYKPIETTFREAPAGGVNAVMSASTNADSVDLSREAVELSTIKSGFEASLQVFKTAEETEKSIIDILV